jgi:hypothetical protein
MHVEALRHFTLYANAEHQRDVQEQYDAGMSRWTCLASRPASRT